MEALFFGFFVFFFLIIFQPFGTYNFEHEHKALLLMVYGVIACSVHFLLRTSVYWKWSGAWSLKQEVLLLLISLLLSAVLSFVYNQFVFNGHFDLLHFPAFFLMVLSVYVFPLLAILWSRFAVLPSRGMATVATTRELTEQPAAPVVVLLKGANKEEEYQFRQDQILFLKSEGNYVKVVYRQDAKLRSVMLRATLKQVQEQLPDSFVQVHRSYLVNLSHFVAHRTVGGKYELVSEISPERIPVSNSYRPQIQNKLQNFTHISSQN
ncbi:LytTR family DNA-binding domain-containing protein [Pontibacter sp. MBLB2868]|uniref:LytTR family DNA-binding domain-containing protein n=1 Tax=Pontibacter sp. MBLB2868 TaxID=3451555 RepID=UPI003F74DB85